MVYTADCDHTYHWRVAQLIGALNDFAGMHVNELGQTYEELSAKGVAWVLARFRVAVDEYPMVWEEPMIRTWPGRQVKWLFPRFYEIELGGRICARASSLWLLVDMETHKPVAPSEYGVSVEVDTGREPPLALPGRVDLAGMEAEGANGLAEDSFNAGARRTLLRRVTVGDLDGNRHMNNARYAAWAAEMFPAEAYDGWRIREMTINYLSETLPGDEVRLTLVEDGGGGGGSGRREGGEGGQHFRVAFEDSVSGEMRAAVEGIWGAATGDGR